MHDEPLWPDWYREWVGVYVASFGIGDDLAHVMLTAWWPAFAAAGFIEQDFAAAMPRLLTAMPVPNWPREHLAAVNRELRAAQEARRQRGMPPKPLTGYGHSGPRCELCNWSGWVAVPLAADVQEGEYRAPYRTAAVVCTRCWPGRRNYDGLCDMAAEKKLFARPMTLDQYELRVDPAWREHMAEAAQATRLMCQAENATAGISKLSRKEIIKRVAQGMDPHGGTNRQQPPKAHEH